MVNDTQLAIRALFYLSLFLGALAIFFAGLFAAIGPAYRRGVRILRRYKREHRQARTELLTYKTQTSSRLLDLEATVILRDRTVQTQTDALKKRETDLHRLKEIRHRTENGLVLANARLAVLEVENERLRRLTAHVEMSP